MPFKTFNNWLFDGKPDNPVPPSLLVYNSPITPMYAIKLFVLTGELNYYLDQNFNHMGLLYLNKEELFKFIKQCVKDFRVHRKSLPYFPYKKKDQLFDILRKKYPMLKDYDITLLCQLIEKSKEKESIYTAFGMTDAKKTSKPKPKKQKKKKTKKGIPLKDFLKKGFRMVTVEK